MEITVTVVGDGVEATRFDRIVTVTCVGHSTSVAQYYPGEGFGPSTPTAAATPMPTATGASTPTETPTPDAAD